MANQKLQNLLYMVLVAGNFLNSGGYAGHFQLTIVLTTILKMFIKEDREHVLKNRVYRPTLIFKTGNAAGMKISSLHKLTDIRSNRWMKKAKRKQNMATINGSQIVKHLLCRPGLNLLQYIAGQVESSQPELLSVVEDLEILGEVGQVFKLNKWGVESIVSSGQQDDDRDVEQRHRKAWRSDHQSLVPSQCSQH